jgi:ATP-dependent Clp protease ATP-binding subunit ClpB
MQKLLHLEEEIHRRVVGQDEAVTAVAEAVIRARTGLKDPNRPVGSFIFLGPTGVGKTELARALAQALFDDEHAMIRIDMSEYQERHTVARLIGAKSKMVRPSQSTSTLNAMS